MAADEHDVLVAAIGAGLRTALRAAGEQADEARRHFRQADDGGHAFTFVDYAAGLFRRLRRTSGVDEARYVQSLCGAALVVRRSPGKSGAFLLESADGRYLVKTVASAERRHLRQRLLADYHRYLADAGDSLLVRLLGFHKLRLLADGARSCSFVVMPNLFDQRRRVHVRFDLKGSRIHRWTPEPAKSRPGVTLKDLDLDGRSFLLHERSALLDRLARDARFLAASNVMDYSLLVGVHIISDDDDEDEDYDDGAGLKGVLRSAADGDQAAVFYMAIIDILQPYNMRKRLAHWIRSAQFGPHWVSSVPPDDYAQRFIRFIAQTFDQNEII